MEKIIFPLNTGQPYYPCHISYLLNMFKYTGQDIFFQNIPQINDVSFKCVINDKDVIFCFSDDNYKFEDNPDSELSKCDNTLIFKYHYGSNHCFNKNVISFSPVSFHNWEQFFNIKRVIKYKCNSNIILNNQLASGNALQRRTEIKNKLLQRYGKFVDGKLTDSVSWWKKINNCLVSVCVPGYCNNMLDRGQFQYMALGACTISPYLPEILPYNKNIVDRYHYIRCQDDYSDLFDKIEWCKSHRRECVEIGKNSKDLFSETGSPDILTKWISDRISKF